MYYVNIFQQVAQEQVSKRLSPSGYALFSKHCTTDYYVTQNMTHMIHVSVCENVAPEWIIRMRAASCFCPL